MFLKSFERKIEGKDLLEKVYFVVGYVDIDSDINKTNSLKVGNIPTDCFEIYKTIVEKINGFFGAEIIVVGLKFAIKEIKKEGESSSNLVMTVLYNEQKNGFKAEGSLKNLVIDAITEYDLPSLKANKEFARFEFSAAMNQLLPQFSALMQASFLEWATPACVESNQTELF